MILEIGCRSEKVPVEITSNGNHRKIRLGGKEVRCDCVRLADGHYSLILDGSVLDALVDVDSETCVVTSRSGTFTLRITDPRRSGLRHTPDEVSAAGVQRLYADMPGKIIRVLIQNGDAVASDQNLLVLEAMKMQNEIRSPKAGIVKEVAVTPDTTVNTGDFLLSIES